MSLAYEPMYERVRRDRRHEVFAMIFVILAVASMLYMVGREARMATERFDHHFQEQGK